jgi:hypothetical protein
MATIPIFQISMQGSKILQKERQKFNVCLIDEILEEALKNSDLYEYNVWHSEHNINASISMNRTLFKE